MASLIGVLFFIIMVLLRTLTKKSKIGFGKWKDQTVDVLLGMNKNQELVSMYFKLSKITFTNDILEQLLIIDNWVIDKPGTNREMYYNFLKHINYNYRSKFKSGSDVMKKETKPYTKGALQGYNHGR